MKIAFIGAGHMSTALVGGLCRSGHLPGDIVAADAVAAQVQRLQRDFAIRGAADNLEAARWADVVVLAVKPQDMATMARELAAAARERRRVFISVAAGVRLADLAVWLGAETPVVRTMPNRPALIGAGVSALCAGPAVAIAERAQAERVLAAAGACVWLEDEALMDAVTAVSGSGPAYFFLLVEALEAAGVALGLPPDVARRLAAETARGAGRMAVESGEPPEALRAQVTSKGGTTAAALAVLESGDLRGLVERAVRAAEQRSRELAAGASATSGTATT